MADTGGVPHQSIVESLARMAAGGLGVGGGWFMLRWVIDKITARLDRRQQQLDIQDEKLDQEWKAIREELKLRVDKIEKQNEALRFAFHHVAGALIRIDPQNPALKQAEQLLAQAFPIDLTLLADRAAAALDLSEERRLSGEN